MSESAPWLNYNHLFYFFMVVTERGIAPAARKLRLSHPTVSEQIRALEATLGETLFFRERRGLTLTDVGRHVFQYAEDIFALGQELSETLRSPPGAMKLSSRPARMAVGVAETVPKLIARRVLASLEGPNEAPIRLVIRQDATVRLLDALVRHELDVLITNTQAPSGTTPRVFSHALGECGTEFFASKSVADTLEGPFPKCLDRRPFLMPGPSNGQHRALTAFFDEHDIVPKVVAEIDDSALMKAYGEDGRGVFAGPSALGRDIRAHYKLVTVGIARTLPERFFLLTAKRRIEHPLVSRLLSYGHEVFEQRPEDDDPASGEDGPLRPARVTDTKRRQSRRLD